MGIQELANKLCRDMVHSVGQRGDRTYITTTFRYPDGDFVALYPEGIGTETFVSDKGNTLFKCIANRIPISEAREETIHAICRRYNVLFEGGVFRKRIELERFGVDCLRFCEALTRVSNFQMESDAKERTSFPEQVAAFIAREISPRRSVEHPWTNQLLDPNGDYPVDYRINGETPARNIFTVSSAGKSTLVSAVSSFFKLQDAYVPTLSIVDPELKLGTHHLNRLQRASTEIRYGLTNYERDIVDFALAS